MKNLVASLFLFLFLSFPALHHAAGFVPNIGPQAVTSAAQVYTAYDHTPCTLTGRILNRIPGTNSHYLFADASGKVVVDINRRVFGDFTVTPNDLVRLNGSVKTRGYYPNEVKVHELGIIGPAAIFGDSMGGMQ